MKLKEFVQEIKKAGLPVAYRKFKTPQDLPFVCYLFKRDNDFDADGINYFKVKHIAVELYCDKKDEEIEEKIESILNQFTTYTKEEQEIESEKMLMILYEMEI